MCAKKTNLCGIVWKARYIFSKQQMLRFYKAYVTPTITYGNSKHGNTFQSQIRILRAIYFKRRYESIKEIMDENKLLTVFD